MIMFAIMVFKDITSFLKKESSGEDTFWDHFISGSRKIK